MSTKDIKELFIRDLDKLKTELEAYPTEESLWVKAEGINNSAGNLILHLCGNLLHFIGATLGETGYIRKRDFEFNGRVSYQELLNEIEETKRMIQSSLDKITDEDLAKNYPIEHFGYPMTTGHFFLHLFGHFSYHLGQVNYHRRILS